MYSLSVQPIRVIVAIISVISHRNDMLTGSFFTLSKSLLCHQNFSSKVLLQHIKNVCRSAPHTLANSSFKLPCRNGDNKYSCISSYLDMLILV